MSASNTEGMAVWLASNGVATGSPEYRLARRQLEASLPADASLRQIELAGQPDTREQQTVLDRALRAWLADAGSRPGLTLVVRDAWLVAAQGSVAALAGALDNAVELDAVVPIEPAVLPPGQAPDYQTPAGLGRFHEQLMRSGWQPAALPTDHEPVLFLARTHALGRALADNALFRVPGALGRRCRIIGDAYVHPLPEYHGSAREEMLALIPPDTRSLLDIGCGVGAFAAAAADKLGCRAVGVEIDPGIARIAGERLDRVFATDALTLETRERFDCVTCLDSLEHIAEPDRLLARIRGGLLRPGGSLVLSVPNVGHWSIVADQVAGRWDYVPAGLLCETHLRFFTERSIRQLLARHGFAIETLRRVEAAAPPALRERLSTLSEIGLPVDRQSLDTLAFHLVARGGGGDA